MDEKELGMLKANCLNAIFEFESYELEEAESIAKLVSGDDTTFSVQAKKHYENLKGRAIGMRSAYLATFGEEVPETSLEILTLASRYECPF